MKKLLFIISVVIVVGFPAVGTTQDLVAMYYYNVFEKKALPVGTSVWTNHGDTECVFTERGIPDASEECMKTYYRGKIVKLLKVCMSLSALYGQPCNEWRWAYRIQFEPFRAGDDYRVEWNGGFDDAFTIYNLPEKWAKHSEYFIRLNW